MKPYYFFFGILLIAATLQSCTPEIGVFKNNQISSSKRDDMHELTDKAFEGIKANDPKALKMILCRELNADHHTIRLIETISNHLHDNKYSLLDEYYVVNKYNDIDTAKAVTAGINGHSLIYAGYAQEMYMAFFVPKTGANKYMISMVFSKYNYGWKVSLLEIQSYTINGKTAPELYQQAKDEYAKNYLVDALNTAELAVDCQRPSSIWQYRNEADIQNFYGKLIEEANAHYKYPFVLSQVATKPSIIRVYNKTDEEGTFPTIYYLSHINLKDTTAIKNENTQIKKVIGQAIPGIDKNKKYVYYSAFNQTPAGKPVEHFDMTDRLK